MFAAKKQSEKAAVDRCKILATRQTINASTIQAQRKIPEQSKIEAQCKIQAQRDLIDSRHNDENR